MDQSLDMYQTSAEFKKLREEVFSTIEKQFNHLVTLKNLNAKFLGVVEENINWYICVETQTKLGPVKIAYKLGIRLFSRDPEGMRQVDAEAGIAGKLQAFSDIEILRLRILYVLFSTIEKVSQNKINIGGKLAERIEEKCWLIVFVRFSSGKLDYDWYLPTDIEV